MGPIILLGCWFHTTSSNISQFNKQFDFQPYFKSGAAKLRLASRMRLFELFLATLWAFRKVAYLFFIFYFYCKV